MHVVVFSVREIKFSKGSIDRCTQTWNLDHCGYCDNYPCKIFPVEPSEEELKQKINIEKQWTWEEEKLMEAYSCKMNMDEFRRNR